MSKQSITSQENIHQKPRDQDYVIKGRAVPKPRLNSSQGSNQSSSSNNKNSTQK